MGRSDDTASVVPRPPPSNCIICEKIWKLFYNPEEARPVNLGSFSEALANPCTAHKSLVQAFAASCEGNDEVEPTKDMGLIPGSGTRSATMTMSITHLGLFWDLLLVESSTGNHPGIGRILDSDCVDLEMLRQWKHDCLTQHGKSCHNPMKIWNTRPEWLIDIKKRCLIPGHRVTEGFVALSYMYGDYKGFAIDAGMLAALQEPLALDKPEIAELVPPIIYHAMYVASAIGEFYLWSDALCVPHHDTDITAKELSSMGAIYASAVVTIIAADDDANIGLSGLQGVSGPRQLQQTIIPFGEEQLIKRNTGIFCMSTGLPYYDRGWTYQEYTMSPRRILFNRRELHWECSLNVWHEELVLHAEVDKYINPRLNLILAGFPDLESLSHIIGEYNSKKLRHDDDALPGISGLLSVLSRSFVGGFLYGIPIMFFDRLLGWQPQWSHIDLHRRSPSARPAEKRLSPSGLPSWSWIGWQGLVSCGSGEAMSINSRLSQIEETMPVTRWFTGPSPHTPPSKRRRIISTWFEMRGSFKDNNTPMPSGWTRHEAPTHGNFREEPFLHPDGCDRYVYRHSAMPVSGDLDEGWYYPFPVMEIDDSTLPSMPEQTEYLFCDTFKATLWGHQSGEWNEVMLVNIQRKVVGSLTLHNKGYLGQFPTAPYEESPGLPVELVVIYKSRTYTKTWKAKEEKYGPPLEKTDVYVVLWVEWIDGVAYRLACGYVQLDAWDGLPLECISLILG